MLLALLGFLTVLGLLVAILSRRVAPLVALIVLPVLGALAGGFGLRTGKFMLAGMQGITGVIGMFVFAILFFGVLTDARMLEPIIQGLLRGIGSRPSRIVPGTALLALLVHLDGSGAVCFLVTIPALLPLYERVGIDRRVLACVAAMAAGVNFLPWTGPTLRASAALHLPVSQIFLPMAGVEAVGLAFVFLAAWVLGRREESRLAPDGALAGAPAGLQTAVRNDWPRHFALNIGLTILVLGSMVSGRVDPAVVFMLGTVVALTLNFPDIRAQQAEIAKHAPAAILMASILFGAGAFTGILRGTGMLNAMAAAAVAHLPQHGLRQIPLALGLISMPLSLIFDPDSFYFGVLPVLARASAASGVATAVVARAALLGMHTTGFPVSPLTPATFLLVGLSDISLAQHQRYTIPWLLASSLVMTLAALAFRVIPV